MGNRLESSHAPKKRADWKIKFEQVFGGPSMNLGKLFDFLNQKEVFEDPLLDFPQHHEPPNPHPKQEWHLTDKEHEKKKKEEQEDDEPGEGCIPGEKGCNK